MTEDKKTVPLTIDVDGERHLLGEAEVTALENGSLHVHAVLDKTLVHPDNVQKIVKSLTGLYGPMSIAEPGELQVLPKNPMHEQLPPALRPRFRPPNKES